MEELEEDVEEILLPALRENVFGEEEVEEDVESAEIIDRCLGIDNISVSTADIAKIIVVRPFFCVADTVLWHHGTVPMGEAIDDTCANSTARHATGNYRGINAVLSEKRGGRRVKENRWASFTENKVVIRIRGPKQDQLYVGHARNH